MYTYSMHLEIEQDKPCDCPKCGMHLEQKAAPAGEKDNKKARTLARKFWIGLMLVFPVLFLVLRDGKPEMAYENSFQIHRG